MDKGSYLLGLRLDQNVILTVGRLGRFTFPAGYYIYAGSARGPGGLPARLARHQRRQKRFHWHIDYLLPHTCLVEVWTLVSERRLECTWAGAVGQMSGARVVAPRFGASDCRCPSHLLYFAQRPPGARIAAVLERT